MLAFVQFVCKYLLRMKVGWGMNNREKIIRLWFDMWLKATDLGMDSIFSKNAIYVESWGPKYQGLEKIQHWFQEWNTRGKVLVWDIKQYFHKGDYTVVEWFFKCNMRDGTVQCFDGMSLVQWTKDEQIQFLKEFGCNRIQYDPYEDGPIPRFKKEEALWF